ncbi:MAG TPA: hypothetical protein HPP97_11345 [Desulfuromonadales bacterium]|nr:hypothetical protein [Desulfuromonadales bacterium]
MSNIGECISIEIPSDDKSKCPFCQQKKLGHNNSGDPKKANYEVETIPDNLHCKNVNSWKSGNSEGRGNTHELPYTIAQHHLISAMQCYVKVRRLVRMGNMVGYDINNTKNGIGLPTTHPSLTYPINGVREKYGDLDKPKSELTNRRKVSFALMEELGAQWHVGHHGFKVVLSKKDVENWQNGGADEKNKEDYPHETGYDKIIIGRLVAMCLGPLRNLCEKEDTSSNLKEQMDALSGEIKGKLEEFKGKNPHQSSPFFVSMRAYEYSKIAEKLPLGKKISHSNSIPRRTQIK